MGLPLGNGGPLLGGPPDQGGFDIIGWVLAILSWILSIVTAVLQFLLNLIVAIVNALVNIFKAIGKFLIHIWTKYLPKAINWLACNYRKFRDWLHRVLKPVIDFFQKVKKWYDTHILAQQLRMLRIIQKIRQFLNILKLLHIGFATTLDRALGDIQNRIEQSISIVRGILNDIINTLALVLDPALFFKRGVLGGSMLGNLGAVKRILQFGDNRPLFASEQADLDQQHALYFKSTTHDHVKTLVTSGPTEDDKANREAARCALRDATDTSLPF